MATSAEPFVVSAPQSSAVDGDASTRQYGSLNIVDRWIGSRRVARTVELTAFFAMIVAAVVTWYILSGSGDERSLSPALAATLLVCNLLPATALLVFLGRRLAINRASKSAIGSKGLLHVRLVFISSLLAAIPTLLVVIFASLLFQSGVQFWYSDPTRSILENAGSLAQGYYDEKVRDVGDETLTMAGDLRTYLEGSQIDDPDFYNAYALQVIRRKLSDSAIVEIDSDGTQRTPAAINPSKKKADEWISAELLAKLQSGERVAVNVLPEKIEVVTPLFPGSGSYLYASRKVTSGSYQLGEQARAVLTEYQDLVENSNRLQIQFNLALYVISLLIIGIAVWAALIVADRLVRPLIQLVNAAQSVADGNLGARVDLAHDSDDEVGILGRSFNRMTQRIEQQTGAIIAANEQNETRRAFIEAVLESVSSGIVRLDEHRVVQLSNSRAAKLLSSDGSSLDGQAIGAIAPAISTFLESGDHQAVVELGTGPEPLVLAVRADPSGDGTVVSFEDITQQLVDQRRAAWADVARRIAHEIKNPLTPINLAAERLRRRFSKQFADEDLEVFSQLTNTITRQVGDLRKIVDEFSSFARMPKPTFRNENLTDIAKQALFLQEVAHPDIAFAYLGLADIDFVCDRRQIAQALTNIVKNAVESIEARVASDPDFALSDGRIELEIEKDDGRLRLKLNDNGMGLPADGERVFEPYMTTREGGTGLGLAIVRKIVEEHFGSIGFADSEAGGACVLISFDLTMVERTRPLDNS